MTSKNELKIILASPRGFCAGVTRAIAIVEKALEKYGKPVYVRHEIVHNKFVVQTLEEKGAIFVDELDDVPSNRPVIFSAHGVPLSIFTQAEKRNLEYLDATCPLVSKVHKQVQKHYKKEIKTILIGHKNHIEVIGTIGQAPKGQVTVVQNEKDVEKLTFPTQKEIGYVTQTTLSVDQTKDVVKALDKKFTHLIKPNKNDICYATTNRQKAIKEIAKKCDVIMVLGAPNSSNSKRLVEVAKNSGCKESMLVQRADEINWEKIKHIKTLGLTAGASAPEILVEEVITSAKEHFMLKIEEVKVTEEKVSFSLPQSLQG